MCTLRMARYGSALVFVSIAVTVLGVILSGSVAAVDTQTAEHSTVLPSTDKSIVCFIIRTYWGHGDTWGDKSLRRLLASLQNQTVGDWEAMLLVMDNRPFPELRRIVRDMNDPRIWVHAEWINFKYNPKEGGTWAPSYHNKLYNLTDNAIRACPEHSSWVVVTNGDNAYDMAFVEAIVSAPKDSDVVSVDFYSRYQRPTAAPCERFEEGPNVPPCKENYMRFCQTDLAANAYRLQRLLAEDRRFGLVDPEGTHGANDGIMAQELKTAGWKIHYVRGRCLVNHAPNPQQCALAGGVWDDSIMTQTASFGGSCVSTKSVVERMRAYPDAYELLELNVTYDPKSFSFGELSYLELRCLRLADPNTWTQSQTFGRVCAARMDVPLLPEDMPPHPWDSWVDTDEEVAVGAWVEGQENEDDAVAWVEGAGTQDVSGQTRDEL